MSIVMKSFKAHTLFFGSRRAVIMMLSYALLVLLTPPLQAMEVILEEGVDSNPFELSDPTYASGYTRLSLEHKGKRDLANRRSLQYSAAWRSQWYDADASDADKHRLDGRLRWINRFKIGERSANLLITGDVRVDRRTYYSQIQRGVATTSRGDSLADRFNYNSAQVAAEFIYRFSARKSLGLYGYLGQRDYVQDYQSLSLESLDYQEMSVQPTLRYKSGKGLYLRAFIYWRDRNYRALLNDNVEGRNLDDSLLVYHFDGYGLLMQQKMSEKLTLQAYLNGYKARDNAEGYRDLDYQKLKLSAKYTASGERSLEMSGNCYSRDYLLDSARPPESETGNSGRLRDGCYLEAHYRAPLMALGEKTLFWQVKASSEYEDNSDDYLSYEKSTLALSLGYRF
jgi:hypothetical protein